MKDKEMIEEMAQIINGSTELDTIAYYRCRRIAQTLYNADYRKTPKDSVMLSREEYGELITKLRQRTELLSTYFAKSVRLEQASKETAEKFANKVKDRIKFIKTYLHAEGAEYVGIEDYDIDGILMGDFDVEIKE